LMIKDINWLISAENANVSKFSILFKNRMFLNNSLMESFKKINLFKSK